MDDRLAQSEDEDFRAEQGELTECSCENVKWGFNCMCDWEKKHLGTRDFSCEFCGLYTAGEPRCNKCEECI